MGKYVIAVVGSRDYPVGDWRDVGSEVSDVIFDHGMRLDGRSRLFISGGARGVDTVAREVCQAFRLPFREYPADWDQYGKRAGYIRNEEMVKAADMVVAFWDGESKGTKHSIDLALKYRKQLEVHFPKEVADATR